MRIVLSRTDRVGDLILSTPAIASVRRSFPRAHVTIVCSRYNSVVMEGSPDVDEVVTLAEGTPPQRAGRLFRGADLAIALAPRARDIAIAGATRARCRIGYTYVRRYLLRMFAHRHLTDVLLSEADPSLSERDPDRPVRHEVDQVQALVARAGGQVRMPDLVVPVGEREREEAMAFPEGSITVQLGERWLRAGSTYENLLALLDDLRALGRPLVVTYGAECAALGEAVLASGRADLVAGSRPFLTWAAILERAACVVTVDTGATHVSSAMRRPTVVLFEHRYFHLNSQEWAPYRVPAAVIRKPADERAVSLRQTRDEIVAAVRALV